MKHTSPPAAWARAGRAAGGRSESAHRRTAQALSTATLHWRRAGAASQSAGAVLRELRRARALASRSAPAASPPAAHPHAHAAAHGTCTRTTHAGWRRDAWIQSTPRGNVGRRAAPIRQGVVTHATGISHVNRLSMVHRAAAPAACLLRYRAPPSVCVCVCVCVCACSDVGDACCKRSLEQCQRVSNIQSAWALHTRRCDPGAR